MGVGRIISGEGSTPCDIMIIGEWPGKDEARSGRPFSGKIGSELRRYFDGTRLPSASECFVTTWIKQWCGPDADYAPSDFVRDEPALCDEIRRAQPRVIVCLGRHIVRWFLGDVDLDETFAIPWTLPADFAHRELFQAPETVVVFSAYNPAAGFRSPDISARIAYQFAQLESVLDGSLPARALYDDAIPNPTYRELTDLDELDEVMCAAKDISTDSEGWPWNPWSVQLTVRPGESFVLRCRTGTRESPSAALVELAGLGSHTPELRSRQDRFGPLIVRFVEWVNTCPSQYRWTFHNALHDLAVFRAIGIDTTRLNFDDTMIMAYNLQLEPQGLKPLCARWCGMKMQHYDEVMGDASFRLAQDWLMMALENEDFAYETRCHDEFIRLTTTPYRTASGHEKPGRALRKDPKLAKGALHKAIERCLRSKDPRKLWGDQVLDHHVAAHPQYGDMWDATLDHVPIATALHYAGRDSDGTARLEPCLAGRLVANNLGPVYQADRRTVPLIDRMQQVGIRPDLAHFACLSTDLGGELQGILARLQGRIAVPAVAIGDGTVGAGECDAFNPNSGPQTAQLLFERFGIDSLKRTPGGDPSTNDKVLEALEKNLRIDRPIRDIISDIREYREVYKLKHTFVDQIPEFVNRWPFDGRIHSTFRLTRVVTGRLAASDPNLLAMPKHGKFAKRFRQGFVSGDGAVLASWDLSQIELRVLAHLSQDPVLLDAFRTGKDLHAALAQRIFGVDPKHQDESKHRLPAKAVNFGIPMGMTNIGLCLELRKNGVDIDEDDAQRWLTETMALYVEVPRYQQGKMAEARRYGYVTDLRGRRRYIGGIRSFDDATRSEAERFAFSTPIQAGAQEIMKEAEAYVYDHILLPRWSRGDRVEPLVQIHDDLVLESSTFGRVTVQPHPDDAKAAKGKQVAYVQDLSLDEEMRYAMTQVPAHWLSVPIETSGDCGFSWGAMGEIRKER